MSQLQPKAPRKAVLNADRVVPASPASDPTNHEGDRTTVENGKLVVVPNDQQQSGQ